MMLTQAWVDKMMAVVGDEPVVIGREPDDDKRDAWTLRFVARLVEVGIPLDFALELYKASEHDYDSDPVDAAEGEIDAMSDDDGLCAS